MSDFSFETGSDFSFRTSRKLEFMIHNMERSGRPLNNKVYQGTAQSDDGVLSYEVHLTPHVEPWVPRTAVLCSMIKVESDPFQPARVMKSFFSAIGENMEAVMLNAVKNLPWSWSKNQGLEASLAKVEHREGRMIFFLSFSTQSSLSNSMKLSPLWEHIIDEVEATWPGAHPWSDMITDVNRTIS